MIMSLCSHHFEQFVETVTLSCLMSGLWKPYKFVSLLPILPDGYLPESDWAELVEYVQELRSSVEYNLGNIRGDVRSLAAIIISDAVHRHTGRPVSEK